MSVTPATSHILVPRGSSITVPVSRSPHLPMPDQHQPQWSPGRGREIRRESRRCALFPLFTRRMCDLVRNNHWQQLRRVLFGNGQVAGTVLAAPLKHLVRVDPVLRATCATLIPGTSVCSTIRRFSFVVRQRRPLGAVPQSDPTPQRCSGPYTHRPLTTSPCPLSRRFRPNTYSKVMAEN